MSNWSQKLTPKEKQFVDDIVDQIIDRYPASCVGGTIFNIISEDSKKLFKWPLNEVFNYIALRILGRHGGTPMEAYRKGWQKIPEKKQWKEILKEKIALQIDKEANEPTFWAHEWQNRAFEEHLKNREFIKEFPEMDGIF